ncbi:Gamma-aminobutyric acid (GABA) B receptor [Seminavis robusta]|uniref:Gamma-aminobutyric acid (GABA) B receptor n=1 Tax=Seminavis robusta TaxID=568900 RepID=A0A9N8EXL1_9STRA|nr:Gamma-aminobutyric acid (GABA) B receptor [Seminavis robusta]|eukprot:Sro1909_g304780.1 Gamma-aminobutyric acid (GABA) B receptor (479) ;mRNA; f:763-2199
MPTWEQRDCLLLSPCQRLYNGTCQPDGACVCPEPLTSLPTKGTSATCKEKIPIEDMGFINSGIVRVGYSMVAIQAGLSLFFLGWTWKHRNQSGVVRLSQPIFLGVIAVGALVMAMAIIPMATETGYRWQIEAGNPSEQTKVPNPDIRMVDAACMAWLWLVALGFVMIYAGLFAKLWRVKMLMNSAATMRRREITPRDVGYIMVIMLLLEGTILLVWQLVAPLQWQREIVLSDEHGYPLKSVGRCTSDHAGAFGAALAILNGGCLVYALVLAYSERNMPTQLSEGTWIALSVGSTFQILLLSIPTLVIAHDDTNASFFVRSTIIFLVSSTSTLLIFGPKFYRLHFAKAEEPSDRRGSTRISGLNFPNSSPMTSRYSSRISSRYSSARFSVANNFSNHPSGEFSISATELERELELPRKDDDDTCGSGFTRAVTTANGTLPERVSEEASIRDSIVEETKDAQDAPFGPDAEENVPCTEGV